MVRKIEATGTVTGGDCNDQVGSRCARARSVRACARCCRRWFLPLVLFFVLVGLPPGSLQPFAPDVAAQAGSANLSIEITDDRDPVRAGEELTYTLTITNHGPADAENVVVTNVAPASDSRRFTATCQSGPSQPITCDIGTLANNATAQIDITIRVDAATVKSATGDVISNRATVASTTPDPLLPNEATESTKIIAADLAIEMSANADVVAPGQEVIYTVTVTNDGPSDAVDVQVILEDFALNVSFMAEAGVTCGPFPGIHLCDLGTMPAGNLDRNRDR